MYLHAPALLGGDKTKAREAADRIERIDPILGPLAFIEIARDSNHENEVEDLFRKSIAAKPANYDAHIRLARYSLSPKLNKLAEAEAIRIDNGRADGHNVLVRALVRQDKWAELDPALAAEPEIGAPTRTQAEALLAKVH